MVFLSISVHHLLRLNIIKKTNPFGVKSSTCHNSVAKHRIFSITDNSYQWHCFNKLSLFCPIAIKWNPQKSKELRWMASANFPVDQSLYPPDIFLSFYWALDFISILITLLGLGATIHLVSLSINRLLYLGVTVAGQKPNVQFFRAFTLSATANVVQGWG